MHQLGVWGIPHGGETADAAEVIVAELAANAVLHGRVPGRDFELGLLLGERSLRIAVTDTRTESRPPTGRPSPPPDDAEGGRGLLLVAALATRWGTGGGSVPRKTVWAELDLP
ncbi:hypothetical protein STRAU_2369 [Streptomyces aurantiacus JA 4570]|uniref:Histidine kinase/HSP90-like ATPase domain-containing protein n=1 Tax=Streptomyces aurantiacus JA 4570 TaxID=1286094 RepID=S4A1M3_9ACTN|nr:hypothetical protein STRAU_2369 [Streptomyces aurantiacus JA 4570]